MKRIKKLASLLLAMVMAFAMTITAFASATAPTDGTEDPSNTPAGQGNFSLTIEDTTAGYTYAIYQIFKGDLSKDGDEKTLSNIEWGASVNIDEAAKVFTKVVGNDTVAMTASEVAASISADSNKFDEKSAQEFASKIAKCISGATVSAETGNVTLPTASYKEATFEAARGYIFAGLDAGYYMVANTAVPDLNGDFTRYMMEIIGDVTAKPKKGTTESDKYIEEGVTKPDGTEGKDYFKNNEAPIGGTVNYTIPVKLPENYADFDSYYLEFADTLSKGLSFSKDQTAENKFGVKVTVVTELGIVNGKKVTSARDVADVMNALTENNSADITNIFKAQTTAQIAGSATKEGTLLQVWTHDLKAATNVKAGTWVILTYSAVLNENAVIGTGNPNYVSVKYSNDPNNSGKGDTEPTGPNPKNPTGETPEKDVNTYTTELAILKNNESGEILADAEFTLSGTGVKITLVKEEVFAVDPDGAYWGLKKVVDGKEQIQYTLIDPATPDLDNKDYIKDASGNYVKYTKTSKTFVENGIGVDNKVTAMVGEDGRIIFTGLGEGHYTLSESKTPAGYNTIDDIIFDVKFDKDTQKFSVEDASAPITLGENTLQADIINQSGSLLPSTGGIGTTIFYVVGGILVIGAGILLVAKKRMSSK